jgi:hypothetical protein
LEDRTVLQVDQTALEDKVLLRSIRKCREIADMDRHLRIRTCGYRKEAIHAKTEPVRNSTGIEHLDYGKSTCKSTLYGVPATVFQSPKR